MMKIDNIWTDLEKESNNFYGMLYKRYSAEISPDLFIALKAQEKLRCIAFKISATYTIELKEWNRIRDIKIEIMSDENNQSKKFLLIILLNINHKDIFSILCEDLIMRVSKILIESTLVDKLLERLTNWQSLFEKVSRQGLKEEEQIGLYGEVYFIRFLLFNNLDKKYCIESWQGPEKSIQDFQFHNVAVEVKTTHGNNHQRIHITSERQLDDNIIKNIFLFHLSLDVRVGIGETLNAIVQEVSDLLADNILAYNLFKIKLLEYGYYNVHIQIYNEKVYNLRQEHIYRVEGTFPRITENNIPKGVGDVKYSIILSETEEWKISRQFLLEQIQEQ